MNEKDFERIGQLVAQIVDSRLERIDARFEQIDARFEQIDARLFAMDGKIETFKSEIISEFNSSLKLHNETLTHKFDLLREGIADVIERVEGVKNHLGVLDAKVEKLDLRLLGHERKPDAHKDRGGYRVKEGEAGFGVFSESDEAKWTDLKRRLAEMGRKDAALNEEINAIYAENGVEPPTIDYDEVIRQSRLDLARYRVEQELKNRREEEKKPE